MIGNRCCWLIIAAFQYLFVAALYGGQDDSLLEVTGMGQSSNGKYFAIVREHGVVQEGDTLLISSEGYSCKIRILAITQKGLKIEKRDIVRKQKETTRNREGIYSIRDPFWPVGYDPLS